MVCICRRRAVTKTRLEIGLAYAMEKHRQPGLQHAVMIAGRSRTLGEREGIFYYEPSNLDFACCPSKGIVHFGRQLVLDHACKHHQILRHAPELLEKVRLEIIQRLAAAYVL